MSSTTSVAYNKSIRFLKNRIINYTTIERMFRAVTNSDKRKPNERTLRQLAKLAAQSNNNFHELITLIMKRLGEDRKYYVHIYKTLILVEYLIKNSCECLPDFWKTKLDLLKEFTEFENRTWVADKGKCVRDKAQTILDLLLSSSNGLNIERELADCLPCKKKGWVLERKDEVGASERIDTICWRAAMNEMDVDNELEAEREPSPLRWDDDSDYDNGSITDLVFDEQIERSESVFTLTLID